MSAGFVDESFERQDTSFECDIFAEKSKSRTLETFTSSIVNHLNIDDIRSVLNLYKTEEETQSLADFIEKEGNGGWQKEKVSVYICEQLEKVANGEIKRLIITVPPRHGKSYIASKKFPPWYLRKYPKNNLMIVSYSSDLAYDFSKVARDTIIENPELFPDISVDQNAKAVKKWLIKGHMMGGVVAAGVGGSITGRGANCAIIDDPFKNYEEASSPVIRESVWQWYLSTLRTRLAPNGSIVVILTRWHQDDLVGRLLEDAKTDGERWDIIDLPAIAEEDNDVLGRKRGEALSPRYPIKELLKTKKALGSYLFSALYQQRPRAKEGNFYKKQWFNDAGDIKALMEYWKRNRLFPEIYAGMDFAIGEKTQNDFNSICVAAINPEKLKSFILLDRVSFKSDADGIADEMIRVQRKWKPLVFGLEEGVIRKAIWSTVKRKMEETGVIINPEFLIPIKDKVARARLGQGLLRQGCWSFPKGEIWYGEFEDNMLGFPFARHEDDVDSFSWVNHVIDRGSGFLAGTDLT